MRFAGHASHPSDIEPQPLNGSATLTGVSFYFEDSVLIRNEDTPRSEAVAVVQSCTVVNT